MPKRLTTEEFIKKAKEVHGDDTYGYDGVVYINAKTKVDIDCPIHGIFSQTPNNHVRGVGCPKCAVIKNTKALTSTTEDFIIKAKEVHGNDTYGYEDVMYVNNHTMITINCHIHGPFEQQPNNHLSGKGCPHCGGRTKITTEDFIIKAKEVHGNDTYGYDGVVYINSQTPVLIDCYIHGEFPQRPGDHLQGKGCPHCGGKVKLTTEDFIAKAKEVHGDDTYGYDGVVYINSQTKVIIDCPIHGQFEQKPNNHLNGKGCPHCGGKVKLTTEDFIAKAKEVHGDDTYGYGDLIYVNCRTLVTINCPIHGQFEQNPSNHLDGKGCPNCGGKVKLTTEEFIIKAKEVHGNDTYGYDGVVYIDARTPVLIDCPVHGPFEQTPNGHLSGRGCINCGNIEAGNKLRSSTEEFITKAKLVHGDTYGYGNVVYINSKIKVSIDCLVHGPFEQTPNNHLNGKGCPNCVSKNHSKMGIAWIEYRMKIDNVHIQHAENGGEYRIPGTRYDADGYTEETNTVYEHHGDAFHGNPRKFKDTDKCHPYYNDITAKELYDATIKREEHIRSLGYNLIVIWEDEWLKIQKQK